jgi:restriction system protein
MIGICRFLLRRRVVRRLLALALLAALLLVAEWLLARRLLGSGTTSRSVLGAAMAGSTTLAVAIWLRLRFRRRLRVRRYESLLALTPRGFEEEIGRLLAGLGYSQVQRVGRPGDLGADLICRDRRRKRVVVQCKRYAPGRRVGSADIQAFIGMMTVHHQADRGLFVTTSAFTAPALDLARQHGVELFDGERLARLVAGGR